VQITKLEKANGFIVVDLDGTPAVGVTRLAPKVLQDGAELLARSLTYTFASFGLQLSGGSAGINAKPEERDDAITGYLEDVAPLVADGRWQTWAGTGVTEEDLAPVHVRDGASLADPALIAKGAVAAARAAAPDASTVAVAAAGPVAAAARAELDGAGLTTVDGDGPDTAADVLLVGGKAGVVDHDVAATVRAKVIVPLSPVPITAKAYAVLSRAETVYVPDFLALAAPLLASLDAGGGDPVERVTERVAKAVAQGVDAWRAAVDDAETYLLTWRDAVPFGRPHA
jgi:glutamate dehydrogenase/leucine dehydrogenase